MALRMISVALVLAMLSIVGCKHTSSSKYQPQCCPPVVTPAPVQPPCPPGQIPPPPPGPLVPRP